MTSVHAPAYQFMLRRLKKAREDAELTQAQVARNLGRPQSYVSKCESGERKVDPIELLEFARLYRRKIEYFLPEANEPRA